MKLYIRRILCTRTRSCVYTVVGKSRFTVVGTQNNVCLYYYLLIVLFSIQTTVNLLLPHPVRIRVCVCVCVCMQICRNHHTHVLAHFWCLCLLLICLKTKYVECATFFAYERPVDITKAANQPRSFLFVSVKMSLLLQ